MANDFLPHDWSDGDDWDAQAVDGLEGRVAAATALLRGSLTAVGVPSLEAHGHSWLAGFGNTSVRYRITERVAKAFGGIPVTSTAKSGAQSAALAADGGTAAMMQAPGMKPEQTGGPYFGSRGLKIHAGGSNEYIRYNVASGGAGSAGAAALVERALTIAYAYLRGARQVDYNAAGHVKSSGVGAAGDGTLVHGTGYNFASVSGEYIEVTLDAKYDGEAITFPIPHFASFDTSGRWNFTLDPAGANTSLGFYDGAPFDTTLKAVGQNGTLGYRIPKGTISSGAHTIRLTSQIPSGGTRYCTYAGFIVEGEHPLIAVLFPPRPTSPLESASAAAAATALFSWANDRVRAAISGFTNAVAVDTREAMAPNYGTANEAKDERFWFDEAHPNDLGAGRVAAAIIVAAGKLVTPAMSGLMNGALALAPAAETPGASPWTRTGRDFREVLYVAGASSATIGGLPVGSANAGGSYTLLLEAGDTPVVTFAGAVSSVTVTSRRR